MSDVIGTGYGSSHNWKKDITDRFMYPPTGTIEKGTRWICRACGQVFVHHYDMVPGIFEEMEALGVPDRCPAIMQENDDRTNLSRLSQTKKEDEGKN